MDRIIKKGTKTFIILDAVKHGDLSEIQINEEFRKIKSDYNSSSNFEDEVWIFIYDIYQSNIYLRFDNIDIEYVYILKSWCVDRMSKYGVAQQRTALNRLKKAIVESNGFDEMNWEDLYELMQYEDSPEIDLVNNYIDFLMYSEMGDYEFYINHLRALSAAPKARTPRKIPDWHTILELDYIIAIYFSSVTHEQKMKYYPFIIWWEFSRVFPMRVSEICLIKKKPLRPGKVKGTYYLEIPTIKRKHNRGSIEYSEIAITKEIYELFEEYLNLVKYDDEREYLFSFKEARKFKSKYYSCEDDKLFFSAVNMGDLIDEFLKEVVEGKFGRKILLKGGDKSDNYIESIDPGDTRHLAIHNMISQGVGPLTVQEFARHDSVLSQMTYYEHLDVFFGTKVQVLADKIRIKLQGRTRAFFYDVDEAGTIFTSRMGAISIIENGKNHDYFHEINGALCEDKHFLKDCQPSGCKGCPYHIGEEEAMEEIIDEYVNEEYKRSIKQIELAIETMRGYVSNVNTRTKEHLFKEQAHIIDTALYGAALAKAKQDIIKGE